MAVTIGGVPESITCEQFVDWLAQIGIDATQTRAVEVGRGGIFVEVRALGPDGKRYVVNDEAATHRVTIRITDEPTETPS